MPPMYQHEQLRASTFCDTLTSVRRALAWLAVGSLPTRRTGAPSDRGCCGQAGIAWQRERAATRCSTFRTGLRTFVARPRRLLMRAVDGRAPQRAV